MRKLAGRLAALLAAGIGAALAAVALDRWVSPRPALLLLRRWFTRTSPAGAPTGQVVGVRRDLSLGTGRGPAGRFHLVLPDGDGPHPLVVWLHGGGWFFGSKDDVLPYVEHLAAAGYAVAALDYPLAPESPYPAALRHLNSAIPALLRRLVDHDVDVDGLVLAGTSAGANLAAQLAVATTAPSYARQIGLDPGLDARQLRGVLLHCGVYDISALAHCDGFFGGVLARSMWSYTGDRHWATAARSRTLSPLHHVTAQFPPTFLTGGTHDPFTPHQLTPMAARLSDLGVDHELLTLPEDAPDSGHDYQYDLAHPSARLALEQSIKFLDRVSRPDR